MATTSPQWKWCEFSIKGASGGLMSWHLVSEGESGYRSACGRLLTSPPENTSEAMPDVVRGICRRCQVIAKKNV
jgi:hypothetical protein